MARGFLLAIAALGLCLLQACSDAGLAPLPGDATILAFGDSLTVGVGAPANDSYPQVLSRLSGINVVNGGVSGETTDQGLSRLQLLLPELAPDMLLLLEGGNDILRSKSRQAIRDNLAAMIEFAQAQGVEVVLIGVPDKMLFSGAAPFYEELAQQFQLVFDGSTLASLVRDSRYKSDAVHLNAAGYSVLAETIHELLLDNGALDNLEEENKQ